jgi:NAD(P)-dependent dehydrogenase (short-subunit alcohol dehydrogenase family)
MKEKTILVTGANRGIGYGLAREFVHAGHTVFATYRSEGSQQALEALSADSGGRLEILQLDVCDDDSTSSAAEHVSGLTDHVDILVNNAGVFPGESGTILPDIDLQKMRDAFEANTIGPVRVTRAFLLLLKQSEQPVVAHISSGAGSLSGALDKPHYAYGTSKAALNRVTRGMTQDPALENFIVTAFTPGWVKTDMGGQNAELKLEDSVKPLSQAILNLKPEHHGDFLDRNGEPTPFKW